MPFQLLAFYNKSNLTQNSEPPHPWRTQEIKTEMSFVLFQKT